MLSDGVIRSDKQDKTNVQIKCPLNNEPDEHSHLKLKIIYHSVHAHRGVAFRVKICPLSLSVDQ